MGVTQSKPETIRKLKALLAEDVARDITRSLASVLHEEIKKDAAAGRSQAEILADVRERLADLEAAKPGTIRALKARMLEAESLPPDASRSELVGAAIGAALFADSRTESFILKSVESGKGKLPPGGAGSWAHLADDLIEAMAEDAGRNKPHVRKNLERADAETADLERRRKQVRESMRQVTN